MRNLSILFLLLFSFYVKAQEVEVVAKENVSVEAKTQKDDFSLDTKNPLRASLYSAVLPGLGQVYNEKYWKVPIVWGAIGTGVGFTIYYDNLRNRFRNAFLAELKGEPHQYSGILDAERLGRLQDDMKRNRDYAIVITTLIYALNIIDATVDAHLYEIKKDRDLSVEPVALANPVTGNTQLGLSLKLNLK